MSWGHYDSCLISKGKNSGGNLAGCIGLKKLDEAGCEMKRLYVRPCFRGQGIGDILIRQIIKDAKEIGYRHMLLDTLYTAVPILFRPAGVLRKCIAQVQPSSWQTVFFLGMLQLILKLSDPLHMKRAMLLAEDTGMEAYGSPTPTTMFRSLKTKLPFLSECLFPFATPPVTMIFFTKPCRYRSIP